MPMSMRFISSAATRRGAPIRCPASSIRSVDEIAMARSARAADVEHLAVARVGRARPQERVDDVVDVDEVAHLRAVAEDLDLLSLERQPDEPADEALAVVPDQLPRAVDVGQPQRAGADAEHVVVDDVVVLAGGLVDAVDVGRPDEVRLVDRQPIGPAVDLARAGEHDLRAPGCAAGTPRGSSAGCGS